MLYTSSLPHSNEKLKKWQTQNWKLKGLDSLELQLSLLGTFVGHFLRYHLKVMGYLKVIAKTGVADEFIIPQQ